MEFCFATLLLASGRDFQRDSNLTVLVVGLGMVGFGMLMLVPGILCIVLPLYRRLFWVRTRAVVVNQEQWVKDPMSKIRWSNLVNAVQTRLTSESESAVPMLVRFQDAHGVEQLAFMPRQFDSLSAGPGARVTIFYKPADPTRARIDEFLGTNIFYLCGFGGGLVLLGLLMTVLSRIMR